MQPVSAQSRRALLPRGDRCGQRGFSFALAALGSEDRNVVQILGPLEVFERLDVHDMLAVRVLHELATRAEHGRERLLQTPSHARPHGIRQVPLQHGTVSRQVLCVHVQSGLFWCGPNIGPRYSRCLQTK